ncbi:MAG: signal peptidase II [Oscillospiraceae bacterium]|nr:signal peptidase II [Oscillospiraceae bacterium]
MKNIINNSKKYILFLLMPVLILLDQIIKFLAENILSRYDTVAIVSSVFHLTYVKNYGAAFGILQNKKIFLIIITSIILVGTIVFLIFNKINNSVFLWSLSLIISGGVGNLIDRIIKGYVVDYIDFRLINFAVFNLADSFVCIGVFLFFIYMIFIEPKQNYDE